MNIVFITAHWPPRLSGLGDFSWHLAKGLVDVGDAVEVIVLGQDQVHELPGAVTGTAPFPRRIRDVWRFAGRVARLRPGVVCLQYEAYAFDLRSRPHLLPLALRIRGCRVAVTYHELWRSRRFGRTAKLLLLALPDRIIAPSAWHAHGIHRYRRFGTPVDVIPVPTNFPLKGADRALLRAQFGIPADIPVVTFFGFVIPEHRIEELVGAIGILKREGLQVHASIIGGVNPAGNSYHQGLIDLAKQQGVADQLTWHGRVDDRDAVGRLLSIADVGVLPYDNGVGENNGTFAALAHFGVPTVTTTGPRSGPMEAEAVAVFTDGSASSLAAAVSKLLDDLQMATELSERAARWSERRSWDVVVAAHRAVIEQCASRK